VGVETMKTGRALVVVSIAMSAIVCTVLTVRGQGPEAADPFAAFPRSEEALPLPPVPNEGEIVKAVFERFPDVNSEELMKFVRKEFSRDMYDFKKLAMVRRDRAEDFLSYLVGEALEMIELQRRDPVRFQKRITQKRLERKVRELAAELKRSKVVEKERKLKELRDALQKAFELRQELMRADVDHMAIELAELKGLLQKRGENRDLIIGRRIDQLTGASDHLDW